MTTGQKSLKMYNLNVNVAAGIPSNLLGFDGICTTPRTPEILNSLMAMTNPFDNYNKNQMCGSGSGSEESCSGSGSPLASPTSSPPSVQHTCSQLIKEGLKLTIQTKRKQSGSDSKEDLDDMELKRPKREELTQEDEERRKRRRERNKIAATKCRLKKREKTVNLVAESEILQTQNIDLKTQIQELETQRRRLMDMLSLHTPTCVKNNNNTQNNQTFDEDIAFVSENHFQDFEGPTDFESNADDFRIDGIMNPYGKDPNFGKVDVSEAQTYTRLNSYTTYQPSNQTATTNPYYHQKNVSRVSDCNRPSSAGVDFNRSIPATTVYRPSSTGNERSPDVFKKRQQNETYRPDEVFRGNVIDNDVFRTNVFRCTDDADSYRPNGIIDNNFFGNKNENFYNNDYAFSANHMDNGCMA